MFRIKRLLFLEFCKDINIFANSNTCGQIFSRNLRDTVSRAVSLPRTKKCSKGLRFASECCNFVDQMARHRYLSAPARFDKPIIMDFTQYKDFLRQLASYFDNKSEETFGNNPDRSHNAALMEQMLRCGAGEICMYCGTMSVFRNEFYDEIDKEDSSKSGRQIKDSVAAALSSFIQKDNSRLRILMRNFEDSYLDDLIIPKDVFLKAIGEGKVTLSRLNPDFPMPEMDHFSFTSGQRIVRFETDPDKHTANYVINGTSFGNLPRNFQSFVSASEPVVPASEN